MVNSLRKISRRSCDNDKVAISPIMLCFGRNALTFGRGTTCSLTFIAPVGFGALQAGVFWLLEEEILHKERRDFVRRQNRGVRKICRRRKAKVSRPLFFNRAERALTVKRIGVLMECSGAERKQNDNLLIPLAHKGKSSDGLSG